MKTIATLLLTAVSSLLFALPVSAESASDFEGGKRHHIKSCRQTVRILRSLDLSEGQTDAMKNSLTDLFRDANASSEERHRAWQQLFTTVHQPLPDGEEFDEQEVRDAFQNLSALKEELTVDYAEFIQEAQRILTDQQYRRLVRARLALFRCSHAPENLLKRVLGAWINQD